MTTIKDMYYDIGNAVKGVCARTYARNRPRSAADMPESYAVVRLPYSIVNGETDSSGAFNDFTTTAQIELYVRDSVSARNPNGADVETLSAKTAELWRRFPIVTERLTVTRPRVTMQTDDGNGFGVAIVQATVRTR